MHTIRDGRDTACSVVTRSWGPDNLDEALRWWARKLERAFRATEGAPAASVLVIQHGGTAGDVTAKRSWRGSSRSSVWPDVPEIHDYFDEWATPGAPRSGAGGTTCQPTSCRPFEALYRRLATTSLPGATRTGEIRTAVQG